MSKMLDKPGEYEIEDGIIISQKAEDVSNQQKDSEDQINSIFSEFGSGEHDVQFSFSVWRILPNEADMAFLFKGLPSDMPITERLRDEFDGGKFQIRIFKNKKTFRRVSINVEKPRKSTVVATVKNDMAEMVKVLAEQQERQFAMLRETMLQLNGKNVTPQPSQMEMMAGMMSLLSGMKAFVTPPPAPVVDSFGPEKMMDLLIKGMELGRESGGGGGDGDSLMGLARDFIKSPLAGSLAQAALTAPKPVQRPVVQQNNPVLSAPVPETNQALNNPAVEPLENQPMHNPVIVHNLKMLVSKAGQGADPVLYAEFILDNVPESMVQENILRDDLIEYFSAINPKVKTHEAWFLEMRDHIKAVLTEDESDPIIEGNPDVTTHSNDPGPSDDHADHTGGDGGDAGHS